jgi:hypothetical protein
LKSWGSSNLSSEIITLGAFQMAFGRATRSGDEEALEDLKRMALVFFLGGGGSGNYIKETFLSLLSTLCLLPPLQAALAKANQVVNLQGISSFPHGTSHHSPL